MRPFRLIRLLALLAPLGMVGQAQAICSPGAIPLGPGAKIVAEGDSLTYGFDATAKGGMAPINGAVFPRGAHPFPEALASRLPAGRTVVNHGFPGDRSEEGLRRWSGSATPDLTLLMFGTNDAGNFGQLPSGPIPVDRFEANLKALIERRSAAGGKVLVLSPPPLAEPAADRALEPYRLASREVAEASGVPFLDTSDSLRPVARAWTDGLHLSETANEAIASAILAKLCVEGP